LGRDRGSSHREICLHYTAGSVGVGDDDVHIRRGVVVEALEICRDRKEIFAFKHTKRQTKLDDVGAVT
jgi:hypothetical protein